MNFKTGRFKLPKYLPNVFLLIEIVKIGAMNYIFYPFNSRNNKLKLRSIDAYMDTLPAKNYVLLEFAVYKSFNNCFTSRQLYTKYFVFIYIYIFQLCQLLFISAQNDKIQ